MTLTKRAGAVPSPHAPLWRTPLWRTMAIVAAVVALATAPGAWVRSSHGAHATGDEPQYLMTAQSLAGDGDLDVSNQRAEGAWAGYSEAGPPPVQELEQSDGRMVSPHDPLLPAVLALPVGMAGWMAAKLSLALLAGALAAAMVWTAVRRFAVPLRVAALVSATFAVSAPLAVYATQIYPELPAALAVTLAVAALTGPVTARTTSGWAVAVVALPWLAVKYAPVAAVLALVGLVRLVRAGEPRCAAAVVAGFGLAGAAYLAAHHAWYGGWTVYAAGDHFVGGELTVVGNDPDYAGRSVRLVGLLTDRHFGLAAWQPAFLLAVPALAALLARRPRGWIALAAPLAAGWLTATFVALTMHGWWWPGRQTVVVLPLVVIAVAWWLAEQSAAVRRVTAAAAAFGVVAFAALAVEGLAGDLTLAVDFDTTVNPLVRGWRALLPDYRSDAATRWLLHGGWTAAIAALAFVGWRSARPAGTSPTGSTGDRLEPSFPTLTKEVIPT